MRTATITLGRDGMGDTATEEDFERWVAYVAVGIDDLTGLDCTVKERKHRDVQTDDIRVEGTEESDPVEDKEIVQWALAELWDVWCSGPIYALRADGVIRTICVTTLEEARAEARAWAEDIDADNETRWVDTRILLDGEVIETVTTAIDPEEPDCSDDDGHDWGPDHVYGHGGGVTISNICQHCGIKKIIDTWASRPDTGEQGLKSLSFCRVSAPPFRVG